MGLTVVKVYGWGLGCGIEGVGVLYLGVWGVGSRVLGVYSYRFWVWDKVFLGFISRVLGCGIKGFGA